MQKNSLVTKFTLIMCLLITAVLIGTGTIVALTLRTDLIEILDDNYGRLAEARADEVSKFLIGHWDIISTLSVVDYMANGTLDEARAIVTPITSSGIVKSLISIAIITEEGTINLIGGGYIDISMRDYYKAIFKEGKNRFISDVLIPQSYDKPAVMLTQDAKRPNGEKFAIVMQISLDRLSEIVGEVNVGQASSSWIVDGRNIVIAHPQSDLIMKQNFAEAEGDGAYAKSLRELSSQLSSSENGVHNGINAEGKKITTFYATVPGSRNWKIGIDVLETEINAPVVSMILLLCVVFIIAIAFTAITGIAITRSITSPIKLVAVEFQTLASGEADLTKKLTVQSRDEVGDLSNNFNQFLIRLCEMVTDLKQTQEKLGTIGDELRSGVKNSKVSVDQISDRVEHMRLQAVFQGECVSESSSAIEQIARAIENLDGQIATQSSTITEASASIEEMVGNIASVSNSISIISSSFKEISSASDSGIALQKTAGERVEEISTLSSTLLEANQVISNIAAQTNLLAMNAAIEAAHAGDAGKGFSVVADEIRKLAETSTNQSKSISSGLKNVQNAILSVVDTSKRTNDSFAALADKIRKTGDLVNEVGAAMGEQKEGSSQILIALKSMNDISSNVHVGSKEMSSGNKSLLNAMGKLQGSAQEIDKSVTQVVRGIDDVKDNTSAIALVTERTNELLSNLDEMVGRFHT